MVSAGGNCLKVWDLLSGGKLLHTLSNHQKTIMDVCLDGTRSRMLSAGLDGFVKIYDLNEFNVTHSIKYSAPVLSVACAVRSISCFTLQCLDCSLVAARSV